MSAELREGRRLVEAAADQGIARQPVPTFGSGGTVAAAEPLQHQVPGKRARGGPGFGLPPGSPPSGTQVSAVPPRLA